jgi:hypothetical protein
MRLSWDSRRWGRANLARRAAISMKGCVRRLKRDRWFEDVVGRHVAAAAEALPPEVAAAARERGRARDLWTTAQELVAEFEQRGLIR